jgi:hypothetical protein
VHGSRLVAAEVPRQALVDALERDVHLQFSESGDRDPARLFGDNQSHAVRFFGDADGGAVARTQRAHQHGVHAERKETGGGGGAAVLDDDRAVMESTARLENGKEEIVRDGRVEADAALDEGAQADLAFDDN